MQDLDGGKMKSPFQQHLEDAFSQLQGQRLIIVGGIWIVVIGLALACAFGLIRLPTQSREVEPTPTPTTSADSQAAPTSTPENGEGGFVTLPTPTPEPNAPASETEGEGEEESSGESPEASGLPALPWGDFGYGIAAHGISMPYYTMDQIKGQLGLSWVKQQVRWDHFSTEPGSMDWSGYDAMVDAAQEKELKVMMSVVGAPDWSRTYFDDNPQAAPPDDFTLYTEFLAEMVERYKGRIHAVEVWNEQNLDREWDTAEGVQAARYVELLRMSYQTIKSRDPNIIVISGALSPVGSSATDPANPDRVIYMDDFDYMDQMIAAGFLDYADCVGAHHNGINMPPDVAWDEGYNDPEAQFRGPFDNPNHSWSFKSTLWGYHERIQQAGQNKPLCVTEFGWASADGFDGYPPGFEFALDNTAEEQAQWDVKAFQLMRRWGFVHLAFLWNLDYSYKGGIGPTDPNAPYSILDFQGAARPAYGAIGEMQKIP
jgi:hypothetical protein